MEGPPPPPPPPHGDNPRSTRSGGLPDGKYDIFVIPPSSAGSGFLYLPSLQTQRNSFLAGCACTALAFFLYSVAVPVVKEWTYKTVNGGGSSVLMLVIGVGVVSWALGKTQGEGMGGFTGAKDTGSGSKTYAEQPPRPEYAPPPPPPPPREATPPPAESAPQSDQPKSEPQPEKAKSPPPKPQSSWQRSTPTSDGKSAWEKAREETRKREEERKRAEEIKRRREELERERTRKREQETLQRLEREWKEKKAAEDAAAKKADEELKAKQAKEETDKRIQREKEKREREAREALLKAAKEAREAKEALEKTRKEETERREREEKERIAREEKDEADAAVREARASNVSSKRPPMPSARTERDDDAYSFRPYDRARSAQKSSAGSVYSDDSYAASATTAKTTPPGSTRGPYTTKDPDKIIIKGVYSFNNAFMRTPISQLISGQGAVTDGLILRITTEGLFIDDDVRGVPQREWDIKAWTMKLAESVELQGHHVLRASIRDQEGKKYVFILSQTEGWKVALGLQRLRKGSQVRALGVAGMPANEARLFLETLGWA